ncbi:uncharacterized protein LOC122722295 [Manihot esculenta]|uniref:uncharacterized protein LOC122722295 n=1 Tax=Manihot esculenta TaxID=3983 RepID=UPI001CC611F6|nr:uncharacterized protein LOC122722295 [Manihot esculenta]
MCRCTASPSPSSSSHHSLHPHHPTAAPRPAVSHTHSPHPASPFGTALARGTGSVSACTPSSAPASAASTTAVGGTQSFRQTISLINNNLHPSEMCSRRITLIVKERLVEEGHCWKTVPNETKEFYWQEFKKKAAERYRGLIWEIRKGKTKNLATPDSVLRKWQKTWNTSEYKEKCEKFSANRRSEAGGSGSSISRHACGSVSQYTHQRRMRERLGREPHLHELFEATHKRKGTEEFVDARLKAIYDKYVHEGSNEPTPINEAQLYYEAVGGHKKSRVYGLGSQASAYFHEPSHCSASYTSAPPVDPPTIETMNRMQNKIDRLETENSRITTRLDELQTIMHRMMAQQGIGTSTQTSAPTAPPAPSPQQRL